MTLRVGELDREYRLHVPKGYDASKPLPVVLAFHGYGRNATSFEERTQLSTHGDANGYIAVFPQATSFNNGQMDVSSWNDMTCSASPGPEGRTCTRTVSTPAFCPPECGECDPCNWCSCYDDVGFVTALLDELEATLCVDVDRVYATGFSNGGMMAYRLACELEDRLAAIAPVSGLPSKGFKCTPSSRMALLHVHGTRDDVVPTTGDPSRFGTLFAPLDATIEEWASSQGCAAEETPYPTGQDGTALWQCKSRGKCSKESEVSVCTWDAAHDWPVESSDVLWSFFRKHSR